jgi:hypothetical protein
MGSKYFPQMKKTENIEYNTNTQLQYKHTVTIIVISKQLLEYKLWMEGETFLGT